MKRKEKLLATVLVLGVLGAVGGFGVFAAFSATTANPGNTITAGTVKLGDNDVNRALYEVDRAKPNDPFERCITVKYDGNIDADVKLYTESALGELAQYLTLTVTPGTLPASAVFPSCAGFTATGDPVSKTMDVFAATNRSFDTGIAMNPGNATKWAPGDSLVYRVKVDLADTDAAQAKSTGLHELKWEARNK